MIHQFINTTGAVLLRGRSEFPEKCLVLRKTLKDECFGSKGPAHSYP